MRLVPGVGDAGVDGERHVEVGGAFHGAADHGDGFVHLRLGHLEQELVIAQARRRTGPKWGEWSIRLFQAIAEAIDDDRAVRP